MQRITNSLAGYYAIQAACALESSGVFAYLKEKDGATPGVVSEALGLNIKVLESLFDYLEVNLPDVFEKKDEKFLLKKAFLSDSFQNSLYFALSYKPVFDNVHSILDGSKKYGNDINRDGHYLSLSSVIHNKSNTAELTEMIKNGNYKTVVDLGCGGGELLKDLSISLPSLNYVGVEIDAKAVAMAGDTLVTQKLIKGDMSKPEDWARGLPGSDFSSLLFIGVTVWHELLYLNNSLMNEVLLSYKELFPGAGFIVVEKNGYSCEALSTLPETLKEVSSTYQLVHKVTNQGLPQSPATWKSLFKSADIELLEIKSTFPDMSIYHCIL